MSFSERLQAIVDGVEGAVAASIMGIDGIPVDAYERTSSGEVDIEPLLIEYSALIMQVQNSAQMFSAGLLEELSIKSEKLVTIIRPVNRQYFVALAMTSNANFGKGRYLLRIHAPKLANELS